MPKNRILLSIIIVSYNTQELTLQTLKSAIIDIHHSRLLHHKTEILIIDNNSSDNSVAACQTVCAELNFPQCQILANNENVGFAQANNRAAQHAQGEFILFLNSDTIVHAGALETLVATFQAHPINPETAYTEKVSTPTDRLGMLTPKLQNPDGSLQRQGGDLPSLLSLFAQMSMLDDVPWIGGWLPSTQHTGQHGFTLEYDETDIIPMGWIAGTALMIRRSMASEIGWFDNNIFMYGEDMEYCLRAQKHHWDVAIQPKATITHYGSASSSAENAILGEIRGYLYIWSKHKPLSELKWLKLILQLGITLRWLGYTLVGKKTAAAIYAKAKYLVQ